MDDAYIPDDTDLWAEEDEFTPMDPFDGLTAGDQDIFFRVVDLLADDIRNDAIDYFMDNPAKIRAVVDNVKQKKELIKEKDVEGIQALFEQEKIVIKKIDEMELAGM